MNPTFYIGATIVLTAASQLLQKMVALQSQRTNAAMTFYLRNKFFWLALALLACGMLTWLIALESFDVSKAYALLSINYLLVPLAAVALFNERLSRRNWLGAIILCIGAVLIGRS
jgi:undecaprenyl phosphate-alpha-L-ara4N flippase subunit ArnE